MFSSIESNSPESVVRNGARTNVESKPLDITPRVYFTGVEYVADLITYLEEYMVYNNVSDKNNCILLK